MLYLASQRIVKHWHARCQNWDMVLSQLEIMFADRKCILQLRGVRPFLSDKYDITKHQNYKYTSDYDKKNELNIEHFLSRRCRLKMDEACDVYHVNLPVNQSDAEQA